MKNTEIAKGVVVQQHQQRPFPFVLPLKSIDIGYLTPETAAYLKNADAIVGSPQAVSLGLADFSSIQDAINYVAGLAGGKIYLLRGTYSGNLTVPSNVFIEGWGNTSSITGNVTFTGNYSLLRTARVEGNITFNANTDMNRVSDCWVSAGHIVNNLGLGGNVYDVSLE